MWVRPACESYLAVLAEKHTVSMPKITLAWMQAAAHHIGATTEQAAQSNQPRQPPTTVFAPPSLPLAELSTVAELHKPEPVVEMATTRTIQGRVQHFFPCPRHRLMSSEQMSQVFQHGGLWLDQPMHAKAMANGWTLDELLDALMQNPVMSSNVIAMPAPLPAPTLTPVSIAPAGRDYSGDFFQAAMAMFDPERKAA